MKIKLSRIKIGVAILCLLVANFVFIVPGVHAGTLTHTSVLEMGSSANANPMIASDQQGLAIDFTTVSSVSSGGTVTITFPSLWTTNGGTVSTTQGNPTNSAAGTTCSGASGLFPGAAALPTSGTLTAAGSGLTITISSVGALSATTNYCTEIASTSGTTSVVNPSTGSYSVTLSDTTDSQTTAIDVLTAGQNAYTVTAVIAPTFTMSLLTSSDTFATNLSASAVTVTGGVTTTINTNAASGWFVWAKDSNAGLTSTIASHTIPSVSTGSPFTFTGGSTGTDHYGLGVSVDNTTNYAYGAGSTGSGLSTTVFNEIATSGAPASNVSFVTHELADISATSPPANDYTDVITLIGAGSF